MTSSSSNETSRVVRRASHSGAPSVHGASRAAKTKVAIIGLVAIAMVAALMQLAIADRADAAGPPYSGTITAATGPAFFGPAPNPIPYCETPVYFDPFPENVNPQGLITVDGVPNASVTTNGITLSFELTSDGPDPDYPGFFDDVNTGRSAGDQPKGVEMAAGDAANITLSEPLFYSQWVFTDVDRINEGFDVVPQWTDLANPGAVGVFGGDAEFEFSGTTENLAQFNDSNPNPPNEPSESINGRVQVDLLSAVTGIQITRDPGNGQSGFAVGGGCAPIGLAKEVSSGPTWNGASFDVSYTIRVRNNLPSTATLTADTAAALAAAASGDVVGSTVGIDLTNVTLQDLLTAPEFASVIVVSNTNLSGNVAENPDYNGDTDVNLILPGETIAPETTEEFELVLQYVPAPAGPLDPGVCVAAFDLLNTATAAGTAAGVAVDDESDEGVNPDPGVDNGEGGVDDPTVVTFDCPPQDDPVLEIVKTVVAGPNGTCPDFAGGEPGDGAALPVTEGGVATYCISVRNTGAGDATNVVVTDPQAPAGFDGTIGTVAAGTEATPALTYDVTVTAATPTTNTATANGDGPNGALAPITDTAVISLVQEPVLEIVKTVVAGPNGTCPDFAGGVAGPGTALDVNEGDTVTYCISVRNTGTGDATNVVVTDPQAPAGFDGTIGTVAGGTEATPPLSYDLVITDATPPTNTATANGDGPNGPLDPIEDTAVINPIGPPVLEVVKTVVAGPNGTCPDFAGGVAGPGTALDVNEGDTVTYCISVRNTGAGDATNVVVTDPQAPASFDGTIGTVAGGTEVTPALSYDLVITGATPPINTATVTGDGPNGPLDPVEDTAVINPIAPPSLEIIKTVVAGPNGTCPDFAGGVAGAGDPLEIVFGDTVTYCISVRNVGEADATNVVVTDPQAPAGFDGTIGTIAGGAEATPALSYDVVVESTTPQTNTATATGDGPNGPLDPTEDIAIIDAVGTPVLEIVKTVVAGPNGTCPAFAAGVAGPGAALEVVFGDTVTYCISVRNTGDADATNVVVTDPQAPAGFDGAIGTIAAGTEATPALSYDIVVQATTPETNTATATGDGPRGPLDPADDTAVIDAVGTPVLETVKTVVAGPNGTCPGFAAGVAGPGAALEVVFGDTVTYCISVRNTGDADATNVVVSDPQAPADAAIGTIAAGAEAAPVSYDLLVQAATPPVNTATATGEGPRGDPVDPADDTAVIDAVGTPVLEIVKTVVPGPNGTCPAFAGGTAGLGTALTVDWRSTVTYCISVRNTGDGDASNVVVTDPQAPATFIGAVGTVAAGAEATPALSYDVVVDENTPPVNTATANGDGPRGDELPSVDDDALIVPPPAPIPDIEITKTVVNAAGSCAVASEGVDEFVVGEIGDVFTWCFVVRNTGQTALTTILLDDALAGLADANVLDTYGGGAAALPIGQSIAFAIPSIVPDDGAFNTVDVSGVPSEDDGTVIVGLPTVTDTNTAAVGETSVTLVKTVAIGADADCATAVQAVVTRAGEPVTYCFTITNTGSVHLLVPVVVDNDLGLQIPVPPAQQVIPPAGTTTVSTTVAATTLINNATVDGTPTTAGGTPIPGAPSPSAGDDAEVTGLTPQLDIVKTVIDGPNGTCPTSVAGGVVGDGDPLAVNVGDTVTYCMNVINSGDVDIENVIVTDAMAPAGFDGAVGDLAIGAQGVVQFDLVVTTDSVPLNTASVTGDDPIVGGQLPPETDTAIIDPADPQPAVSLSKTVVEQGGDCADAVEGTDELVVLEEGDDITWCFVVTNTGNVPLTTVTFDDAPAALTGVDVLATYGTPPVLLVDGVITFSLDATIPANGVDNVATVSGLGAELDGTVIAGLPEVEDENTAAINEAALDLQKTVAAGADADCATAVEKVTVNKGLMVTYCFTVTNTGGVDMKITEVVDDTLDVKVPIPAASQILTPGAVVTVKISQASTGDLVNTASITGIPVDDTGTPIPGAPPIVPDDIAEVDTLEANVSVIKSIDDSGPHFADTLVTYTFVVLNEGPDPAEDVTVVDTLPAGLTIESLPAVDGWACTRTSDTVLECAKSAPLGVDEAQRFMYTATITSAAAANVDLVNSVKVDSSTPDPNPDDNEDEETTKRKVPPPPPPPPTEPLDPPKITNPPPSPVPPTAPPLAITGSQSSVLAALAAGLLSLGGVFAVGARRRRDDLKHLN